jgi:predicted metal-dependent peptidase
MRGPDAARGAPVAERPAVHVHRGTRAVQRMVEHAPSSGGLALWVRHEDAAVVAGTARAPVTTDGHTLFYDVSFERLPVEQQAGWVAHGVLHVALRHAQRFVALQQRTGDVDLRLFNLCADAIVNSALSHLAWLRLPPQAVRLEQVLQAALGQAVEPMAALLAWDVERLYREIDDRERAAPRRGGAQPDTAQQEGTGGGATQPGRDGARAAAVRALGAQTASDLAPGAHTAPAPEDEAEQTRLWSERLVRGHAGDATRSMLRALLADLPRVRTPWEQVLRTQLARALAPRPDVSWSRPSRSYLANQGRVGKRHRMPWEPGTTASRRVPRLVVAVDVSGSVDDALMQRFARELEALSRRLEAPLVLVVGDDRVRGVQTFAPGSSDLRGIRFVGGGGTDFTPLLEEVQRQRPDIAVVLTDLQGPARFRPSCPVIWAVPGWQPAVVPPFGRVLSLQ